MSDAVMTEQQDDQAKRSARDWARLKAIATRHGMLALAGLTLWGVADYWATQSGLLLAEVVALLNGLVVGIGVSYLAHEWGHFSGARLSGAISPVLKEPVSFFMFNFHTDKNSRSQFLAMSLGGPVANWLLALAVFLMLPLDTAPQAMLLAAVTGIAISVSVFEVPVIRAVMYGEDAADTLARRQREAGNTGQRIGMVAGALIWLAAI